jgi:hypothetical protein
MSSTDDRSRAQTVVRGAQKFAHKNATPTAAINDFFIAAICAYVKLMKRKQIDAAFAEMAEDTD